MKSISTRLDRLEDLPRPASSLAVDLTGATPEQLRALASLRLVGPEGSCVVDFSGATAEQLQALESLAL